MSFAIIYIMHRILVLPWIHLPAVSPDTDTVFYHRMSEGFMLAGCYAVSAIDSFENESAFSAKICVDNCIMYELPNVFTPNGDGINDTLYFEQPE